MRILSNPENRINPKIVYLVGIRCAASCVDSALDLMNNLTSATNGLQSLHASYPLNLQILLVVRGEGVLCCLPFLTPTREQFLIKIVCSNFCSKLKTLACARFPYLQ